MLFENLLFFEFYSGIGFAGIEEFNFYIFADNEIQKNLIFYINKLYNTANCIQASCTLQIALKK